MKPPVIVIPGITGTALRDEYPLEAEPVWGLPGPRSFERIALHTGDLRYEERQPSRVRPDGAFSIPYHQFVRELRHDLSPAADLLRPVHLFDYDWRQPLDRLVDRLLVFMDEVAGRTALLRHYHADGYADAPVVDLVGHSMGGLLAAGVLARHADGRRRAPPVRVRRVVTMGTPFGGSFEAVIKIITGTAALGGGVPSSREREAARVTPSLYHLLPRFPGALIRGDGALPDTLFRAEVWQRGVVASIAEHMRRHGLDAPEAEEPRRAAARAFLQEMLDNAAAFRDRVDGLEPAKAGLTPHDWLAVVGVGQETRVRLLVEGPASDPFFNLRSLDRKDSGAETGDGTVPLQAAIPPGLDAAATVAVAPGDFGYWEIPDRIFTRIAGLHALLPAMNRVIKLSGVFLDGEAGRPTPVYRGLEARRPPQVAEADWRPPLHFA